jgi:hypothetical protein
MLSRYLIDDIQPTLQLNIHNSSTLVYIAPTSANKQAFRRAIDDLKSYDAPGDQWMVEEVSVVAVIGNLITDDHTAVLRALLHAQVEPQAFGYSINGASVVVIRPDHIDVALNAIHQLIVS